MAASFFSEAEEAQIVTAIRAAEQSTSGEIRVHVERNCTGDAMERAAYFFKKLGMHRTKLANGVMIYVALEAHRFAIIGDRGINEKVPTDFWESTRNHMAELFKQGLPAEAIAAGVSEAGEQLKRFFPVAAGDVNELSNEVTYGDHA